MNASSHPRDLYLDRRRQRSRQQELPAHNFLLQSMEHGHAQEAERLFGKEKAEIFRWRQDSHRYPIHSFYDERMTSERKPHLFPLSPTPSPSHAFSLTRDDQHPQREAPKLASVSQQNPQAPLEASQGPREMLARLQHSSAKEGKVPARTMKLLHSLYQYGKMAKVQQRPIIKVNLRGVSLPKKVLQVSFGPLLGTLPFHQLFPHILSQDFKDLGLQVVLEEMEKEAGTLHLPVHRQSFSYSRGTFEVSHAHMPRHLLQPWFAEKLREKRNLLHEERKRTQKKPSASRLSQGKKSKHSPSDQSRTSSAKKHARKSLHPLSLLPLSLPRAT